MIPGNWSALNQKKKINNNTEPRILTISDASLFKHFFKSLDLDYRENISIPAHPSGYYFISKYSQIKEARVNDILSVVIS